MSLHDLHEIGSLQIIPHLRKVGSWEALGKCVVLFFLIFLAVLIQMYINEKIRMNNKISQQRCLPNIDVIYIASINKNI